LWVVFVGAKLPELILPEPSFRNSISLILELLSGQGK